MNCRNTLIFIVFLLLTQGCNHAPRVSEVIKVNPSGAQEEIMLSEFVDSVKYIRLQTDADCLMGRIRSVIIRDKYIYAFDQSQMAILIFDKDGSFISKLDKQGNGPDEYRRLGLGFVDENEEYVEFFTPGNNGWALQRYSLMSFELTAKVPMPMISANSCRRKGGIYYFSTQQIDNIVNEESTNAGILVVENGMPVKKLFDKTIETGYSYYSYNIESFTESDRGELYVSQMFDNTFYKLDNKEAEPAMEVDFGRNGIDNSTGLKSIAEQRLYLEKISNKAYFPVLNINNTDIMGFSYYYKPAGNCRSELHQYLRFSDRKRVIHVKNINNDITGFPAQVFLSSYYCGIAHEVWYNDWLVDIVQPGLALMKENKQEVVIDGLGTVSADDNPVIILMKLKRNI